MLQRSTAQHGKWKISHSAAASALYENPPWQQLFQIFVLRQADETSRLYTPPVNCPRTTGVEAEQFSDSDRASRMSLFGEIGEISGLTSQDSLHSYACM